MRFFSGITHTFGQQGRLSQVIIINVSIFLVANISLHIARIDLIPFIGLPVGGADFLLKPWTLFTYMFTHESLGHIFWNMILFYFSARLFFLILGEKRLLYVYVMSGITGGVMLLLCGIIFPDSFGGSILIGASAAVTGVVMVMAIYAPYYNVSLWGLIDMPYKYFAGLTFIMSTLIDFSVNSGGKISHIGGALFGLSYGYLLKKGVQPFSFQWIFNRRSPLKVVRGKNIGRGPERKKTEEARMNELLEKISKGGYDSLTKKEKEELFELSQKK